MTNYIDGFVFLISREHLDVYTQVAETVAQIYEEHGALNYVEFVGDDMEREGIRPFPDLLTASQDETVVFGWITFESRKARDAVNQKVESDPRMADLVAPLMNPEAMIFDPQRMAYGGFRPLVSLSGSSHQ